MQLIKPSYEILTLRTSKAAHPQMRELMLPLLCELKSKIPVLFDDIYALVAEDCCKNAKG